jgi:WhiB family transcriptional regulator, redox-sensing transcriptional regulator
VTVTTSSDIRPSAGTGGPETAAVPGLISWRRRAACRHVDTELFFPVGRGSRAMAETQQAKAICARCPVRQPCLAYALATGQAYGIWGGYDEDERRVLHRQRRESAGGSPAGHQAG